jgi:hypothetical protein
LTTVLRVDIELLMRRTIEMLGGDRVRRQEMVIDLDELSLDATTPDRLLNSASRSVLDRLPSMHQPVELLTGKIDELGYPSVYECDRPDGPARIQIAGEVLADPLRTTMELAYQYSSHYWHQVSSPRPLDMDPRTTALLPICCGLGILASDASLYDEQWSRDGYAGWSISRCGHYTAVEIGYAMALLARFRGEDEPEWLGRLRLDSRATVKQARRYFARLDRTRQSLLFEAERIPTSTTDQKQLAQWLAGEDPSFAMAAAYALCQQEEISALALDSAMHATRHGEPDLVPLATKLLGRGRTVSEAVVKRVRELMDSPQPATALAAFIAGQSLGIPLNSHRRRIAKLLDRYPGDSLPLLELVGGQGHAFASLEPQICAHLSRAIEASDDELASALIECLRRIADRPRQAIERRIRGRDAREAALQRFDAAV